MSPRKTRRGAKADGANDTLSDTISKKSKENSPPPSQRIIRTRHQLSKIISAESEADQSLEVNKSKRKTVQETPSGKSTRSRKKAPVDNALDESSVALDVSTITKKRTRRTKNNDVVSEQIVLLDGSVMDDSRVEKSRGTRGRKKVTKKGDPKSEDESTEVVRSSKRSKLAKNLTITANNDETIDNADGPMSKEDAEVQQSFVRISRLRATASTPSSPRPVVNRRGRNASVKIVDFTPESSPITVALSPHRSTKTPRKSPMNLGSPKTHTEQSLRLSKTPRKLPVVEESPAPSEISIASSNNDTPENFSNNLSINDSAKLDSGSARKRKRSSKRKLSSKTPRKSPDNDLSVRKFSKSPKIVLRSPKAKSSKSKSPRVVASSAKRSPVPKSFVKSPIISRSSQSSPDSVKTANFEKTIISTSSKGAQGTPSPNKTDSQMNLQLSRIDLSNNANSPRPLRNTSPSKRSKTVQKSPTVALNKISLSDVTPETTTRSLSRRSNIDESPKRTPIKTPSAEKRALQGGDSPRRSKSAGKKRTSITNSGTPLRPVASPRISGGKRSIGKFSVTSSNKNTPIDGAKRKFSNETAPMLSSTPRERIRRSLNLSPGFGGTPLIANSLVEGAPVGSSTLIGDVRTTRSSFIEDVTNNLISEDDESFSLKSTSRNNEESRLDETFELVRKKVLSTDAEEEENGTKVADGTYELIEPKTPNLRRKSTKRSLGDNDTSSDERTAKRICRVRFASPPPSHENNKSVARGTVASRSATPGHQNDGKRMAAGNSNVTVGRNVNNLRKRSNSMTSMVNSVKTPIADTKRRSNSTSDASVISANKTAQNASVNRLSKPKLSIHQSNKKPGIKTPAARKAPNFAQIHERKFAKMESLVDAKKRVEKRHLAINSQIPTSMSKVNTTVRSKTAKVSPKPAPSVPVNGAYNRYGFKLRKNDAMKIVSQKQPVHKSEKKSNENRLLLKGVRTNRRFELIMKARNINQ